MLDESILAGGGGNLHLGTLWRWYVVLVTFSAREKCVRWLYSTACILLPANIRVTFQLHETDPYGPGSSELGAAAGRS